MSNNFIELKSADETEHAGEQLAKCIRAPLVLYLEGQLGAGKTTFVKGLLRGLGFNGLVKSPTYTLIELYPLDEHLIVHADLYRIKGSEELDLMGFRDYFDEHTIMLIEWASHASDWLPKPDLLCTLAVSANGLGRCLKVEGQASLVNMFKGKIG